MSKIEQRKVEHIEAVLADTPAVHSGLSGLETVRFEHVALPELNLTDVDLTTTFLGRQLNAPILVSSMTGGPELAAALNRRIAEACQALGLAFGVGSQRIALEGKGSSGFGPELRTLAPDVPIYANFGAAQLAAWDGPDMAQRAMEMISADALIVHLNPLQEAVQDGGDTNWRGLMDKISEICRALDQPVIIKEVGAGISGQLARRLVEAGAAAIDVAGVGGTSWAGVEAERAGSESQRAVAAAFRDWGIPTSDAITDVRRHCPTVPIIASGGIKTGVDTAKALRLGANMAGLAGGLLSDATTSTQALIERLNVLIQQLRIACFCTGSRNIDALKRARLISA